MAQLVNDLFRFAQRRSGLINLFLLGSEPWTVLFHQLTDTAGQLLQRNIAHNALCHFRRDDVSNIPFVQQPAKRHNFVTAANSRTTARGMKDNRYPLAIVKWKLGCYGGKAASLARLAYLRGISAQITRQLPVKDALQGSHGAGELVVAGCYGVENHAGTDYVARVVSRVHNIHGLSLKHQSLILFDQLAINALQLTEREPNLPGHIQVRGVQPQTTYHHAASSPANSDCNRSFSSRASLIWACRVLIVASCLDTWPTSSDLRVSNTCTCSCNSLACS